MSSCLFSFVVKFVGIDEEIICKVFQHNGLARYTSKHGYSVMPLAWAEFIREYNLEEEVEVTHFFIRKKKRIYLKIGSWHAISHPRKTPSATWSLGSQSSFQAPRLRITAVGNDLAKWIGEIKLTLGSARSDSDLNSSSSDGSEEMDLDAKNSALSDGRNKLSKETMLPDPLQFPMLHFLFSNQLGNVKVMDQLLKELKSFHQNDSIKYTRGNNTEGLLLNLPSFRSLERYKKYLARPMPTFIDEIVSFVSRNSKCVDNDVIDFLLDYFSERFPDNFAAASVRSGVETFFTKQMDPISVEAMLCDANISTKKARKLFTHMRIFFGRSMFASEKKRRAYFGNNDFPPNIDKHMLPDKTIIHYWWKSPDKLLQNQLSQIVTCSDLEGINSVDLVTGGDHGGGKLRMLLKVILRFSAKPSITRLFEIANVSHSKDDIGIIQQTVLEKKITEGFRIITDEGSRFIVKSTVIDDVEKLVLSFAELDDDESPPLCNVPCELFIHGDLKYFAQMLGRDGMSSSWCMWYQCHPSSWKTMLSERGFNVEQQDLWTVTLQKQYAEKIRKGELKAPKEKKGIVTVPIFDFVEPKNYIFPLLHFEIGAVNNVLDNFRSFVEEQVEMLSEQEKTARNRVILADVSATQARSSIERWNSTGGSIDELRGCRVEKARLNVSLRATANLQPHRESLITRIQEINARIKALEQQEKQLKADATAKQKALTDAKSALKKIQSEKTKLDIPVVAGIENIFLSYNIAPAAYHGGKLNGVDCCKVMKLAHSLFSDIKNICSLFLTLTDAPMKY